MHELSIALSIVDGALEEMQRQGATVVSALHLRLGRLAGVDKDALQFSYNAACQDTVLKDSRLIIEDVEVSILCPACGTERATKSFPMLICAECGHSSERVVHGRELEITALEIVE